MPKPDSASYWIERTDQIACLASPVRQEMLDAAHALGPTFSVRELAEELGRPADGLYYHVRALLTAGLFVEAGDREAGRRREAIYRTPGGGAGMRMRYDPEDPELVTAISTAVGAMTRIASRDFAQGFRVATAVCDGADRNLWASRCRAWLSREEVREAHQLLERLREIFLRPRTPERDQLQVLTFVHAPVAKETSGRR